MRFLGHRVPVTTGRVDARFQGEVRTDLLHRHEGVCLKHRAGCNGQKAYDKSGNLLRIENTINRPEVFTVYRTQPAPLCRPITHAGPRYRALNPLNPSDAALLRALRRGEWTVAGLRNRDLQALLYVGAPRDKKGARRRTAAVGRKLRLLRAHGLIRKLPHTHRYLVTESGRAVLTALVAAQAASTEKLTQALAA